MTNELKDAYLFTGGQIGSLRHERDRMYIKGQIKPGDTVVLQSRDERVIERFNGTEWVKISDTPGLLEAGEDPDYESFPYLEPDYMQVVEDIDTGERMTATVDLPDEHYLTMFLNAQSVKRSKEYVYVTDTHGKTYIVDCTYEETAKLMYALFRGVEEGRKRHWL